jgi:hypothetical protein
VACGQSRLCSQLIPLGMMKYRGLADLVSLTAKIQDQNCGIFTRGKRAYFPLSVVPENPIPSIST